MHEMLKSYWVRGYHIEGARVCKICFAWHNRVSCVSGKLHHLQLDSGYLSISKQESIILGRVTDLFNDILCICKALGEQCCMISTLGNLVPVAWYREHKHQMFMNRCVVIGQWPHSKRVTFCIHTSCTHYNNTMFNTVHPRISEPLLFFFSVYPKWSSWLCNTHVIHHVHFKCALSAAKVAAGNAHELFYR